MTPLAFLQTAGICLVIGLVVLGVTGWLENTRSGARVSGWIERWWR